MFRVPAIATLAALFATACGSSSTGSDGDFVTCETETRAKPYQAGMAVTSLAGTFIVSLMDATPAPPRKYNNSWVIQVAEAVSGAALDGLDITVTPFMPEHQHGTRPVVVTPTDSGTYQLDPLYLFMSGVWEVRANIAGRGRGISDATGETVDTSASDLAIVPICIP